MLLSRLVETWRALSATRSRLAKRQLLADVLGEAEPAEVEIVVSYLSGSLRQRRTGVGGRSLRSLPPPAEVATLTVAEVDEAFEAMAALQGAGSVGARAAAVDAVFARATAGEQEFLRGLVYGELRQGALEALVQEGLAVALGVPLPLLRRAAMLLSSTTAAAAVAGRGGAEALGEVSLQVGTAVQPMLAASAADPDAAIVKTGLPAVVDYKLDGIRVQVHRKGSDIRVFTRSLDDITARLPDVTAVVAALSCDEVVLDGEALAFRDDGRPELFQAVASRTMSSADVANAADRLPLRVFFFDLLRYAGQDLLDEPLSRRIEVMREVLPPALIVPRVVCDTVEEVTKTFAAAVTGGFEGVVVKNPAAAYAAGRRDAAWVKLKPRHTFDLVVTAIEWGHGRRKGWLSNLHLAARDPVTGGWVMLGKTFKGLTDEMLGWQTRRFLDLADGPTDGWVVQVRPEQVVEIACDGLQVSTRYPGGVALRFARVLRYRTDKTSAEADTIDTVKALSVVVD